MTEIQEQDESVDSSTSIIGRKRDFNESAEIRDVSNLETSEEEDSFQRSSKRVKQDHELLDGTGADDGMAINSSPPSRAESPPHSQAEPATVLQMDKQKVAGSMRPAMTWNKGVQSGLRTSFAGKVKSTQLRPLNLPTGLPASDEGNNSSDVVPEETLMRLQSSTHDVHLSVDNRAEVERPTLNNKRTGSMEDASESETGDALEFLGAKPRENSKVNARANGEEYENNRQPIYPRDISSMGQKGLKPVYGNSKGKFKLLEVFIAGQPVSLQDLQFSDFLNSFLEDNFEKVELLTARQIRRAFSTYVSTYYGHVTPTHAELFSLKTEEANTEPAIKLSLKSLRAKRAVLKQRASAQETKPISLGASQQPTASTELQSATNRSPLVVGEAAVPVDDTEVPRQPFSTAVRGNASQRISLKEIDRANIIRDTGRNRSPPGIDGIKNHPRQGKYGKSYDEDMVDVDIATSRAGEQSTLNCPVLASSYAMVPDKAIYVSKIMQSAAGGDQNSMSTAPLSSKTDVNTINEEISSALEVETEAEAGIMDVDFTDLEMALQQKYFPTASTEPMVRRCLTCAGAGHRTLDCPALTCALCGITGSHTAFTCPQSKRCSKCRQRGHQSGQCPEKLLPAESEVLGCDICNSKDHLEESCHFIWRSFAPKPEEISTVRDIAVHCYACGTSGHYGPDCGLRKKDRILSGGITWSKSNLQKYIDVNSRNRAISAGVDYSIPNRPRKDFSIRGRANNPITLDDSEDEDTGFVRPKINRSVKYGHIHFGDAAGDGKAYQRPPNPSRESRPSFGHGVQIGNNSPAANRQGHDSARYNRERTFSPPPKYEAPQLRNNVSEDNRNYRSESQPRRKEDNTYRPAAEGSYAFPMRSQTSGPDASSSRGGPTGRGGRGGGEAGHKPARGGGTKRKPRITKKDRERMAAARN
jgi:hypothetical protein